MQRVRFPLFPGRLRWLGVLAVAAAIGYFSLLTAPPPAPPEPGPLWDKKLHFAAYAILGLSLIYATAAGRRETPHRIALSIGVAMAFGVLIELLQGPLPHRYFSYGDMLANALGALLATGWFLVETHLEYVQFPH